MTDVFISYASEDRQLAECLANCLTQIGWSVWWDRNIIIGEAYDLAIEDQLQIARTVVVLWSKHSVVSEWVKNEAAVASERGVLIPANIDNIKLPLEFRRKQTANLVDWKGEASHLGFQALLEGLARMIGSGQAPQTISLKGKRLHRKFGMVTAALITIFLIVVMSVFYFDFGRRYTNTTPQTTGSDHQQQSSNSPELSELVVGDFFGAVIADSKGGSRSNVRLAVTRLGPFSIRVTSDYPRLGEVQLQLTRIGNKIFNEGGDSVFIVDLDRSPYSLDLNLHNEVAFSGSKHR